MDGAVFCLRRNANISSDDANIQHVQECVFVYSHIAN